MGFTVNLIRAWPSPLANCTFHMKKLWTFLEFVLFPHLTPVYLWTRIICEPASHFKKQKVHEFSSSGGQGYEIIKTICDLDVFIYYLKLELRISNLVQI